MVYLAPNKYFRHIPDLVAWYETNSLVESFQGMTTTLRIPYKKALLPQLSERKLMFIPFSGWSFLLRSSRSGGRTNRNLNTLAQTMHSVRQVNDQSPATLVIVT